MIMEKKVRFVHVYDMKNSSPCGFRALKRGLTF